jgi:hypothetical protein
MRAEKVLGHAGLSVKLVSTPRQLSADCGVALRFPWSDLELVRDRLLTAHVEIDRIHPLE